MFYFVVGTVNATGSEFDINWIYTEYKSPHRKH